MTELLEALVIRFPARSGYLAISRLNATAMAAGAGFDVDGLDDLRLAIDEAVTWLVGLPSDAPSGASDSGQGSPASGSDDVELTIRCGHGRFEFRGTRDGADPDQPELDDLLNAILGATVDDYGTGTDDSGRVFIDLVKRSPVDA